MNLCNCISWTILILFDVLECKYFLCCPSNAGLYVEGRRYRIPLLTWSTSNKECTAGLILAGTVSYSSIILSKCVPFLSTPHPFLSLLNKYSQIHYVTKLLFKAVMQQVQVTRFHWTAICTNLICHHGFDISPKTSIWPRGSMLPNIALFVTTQSF